MFGQLLTLKFPTYRLKSTTSKHSRGVKIVSGVKPVGVDLLDFRELGLQKHFDDWVSSQCALDEHLQDWSILLRMNFAEYSVNTFFDQESLTSFGRHILALPGVSKERVKNINTPAYILKLPDSPPATVTKYRGIKRKYPDEHDIALERDNHSKHSLLYDFFVNTIN